MPRHFRFAGFCVISGFVLYRTAVFGGGELDWRSPVGPDGVTRIIIEAEAMKGINSRQFGGTGPDWRIGRAGIDHYQCNIFGGHWQSRTRTAMTDAGGNRAVLSAPITIPSNGTYKLWAKYECPPHFNYAFDVVIRRPGLLRREVFRRTYGLESAVKHYSFNSGLTTGSLYWTWGIDHDAAEGYPVELTAGRYELRIEKVPNPAPAGMRSVDVLMLTSDLSPISSPRYPRYPLLDELRRANHLFIRFHIGTNAPGPCAISWNRAGKRYSDFYVPIYREMIRVVDRTGRPLSSNDYPLVKGQPARPLSPGEWTPWLDIGPCLNVESAAGFLCSAAVVDPKSGKSLPEQPAFLPLRVDVALEPSERAVLKTFSVRPERPARAVSFMLQPDLTTNEGLQWSRPLSDIYQEITQALDAMPRRAGRLPRLMRFYGYTGEVFGPKTEETPWSRLLVLEFRHAIGLNTMPGSALTLDPSDYEAVRAFYRVRGDELLRSATHHHSQDPEKVAAALLEKGTAAEFHYLSFGDEIGLPPINGEDPAAVQAFRAYLQTNGITLETLGLESWDHVKPLAALSRDVAVQIGVWKPEERDEGPEMTLKRLFWHSARFRIHQGIAQFVEKTRLLREKLGPEVHTSANLGGMHPFYWMHQSSFIESFKHQAMTLAWTEDYDYCQPEGSRLVVEFLAGYLKCGTKYHGQRMMFYCMPHYPGQSPEHLLQNAVLLWGQNVKDLDWFSIPPDGFATENYVNPRGGLPTYRMMRRISDMAARTETWLEPARPVDAAIALLLSEASDLWELGGKSQNAVRPGSEETQAIHEERKSTYYCLRNAGYRVDLITEADVQEGWLERYRALYVGGENMERRTAAAIAEWVRKGGVLYASVGAARKDEYDEPLEILDGVLGRGPRRDYRRYRGALRAKIELPFLEPIGRVSLTGEGERSFPALASLERFAPASGVEVLGRFEDGSPAFIRQRYGQGTAWYIGTQPATAWLQKALPRMPCGKGGPETAADGSPRYPSFEPVDFHSIAGSVVLEPLRASGVNPDIVCSAPNVVANRLTGPKGTVLTLVNLGMQQRGAVAPATVQVHGIERVGRVWSYEFPEGIEGELAGGSLRLVLPRLEWADVVVIEK